MNSKLEEHKIIQQVNHPKCNHKINQEEVNFNSISDNKTVIDFVCIYCKQNGSGIFQHINIEWNENDKTN